MKIELRAGTDWTQLIVDGATRKNGHELRSGDWIPLLRELGATVETPDGDFCSGGCDRWLPGAEDGALCDSCADWEDPLA